MSDDDDERRSSARRTASGDDRETDDWFERALRERKGGSADDADGDDDDSGDDAGGADGERGPRDPSPMADRPADDPHASGPDRDDPSPPRTEPAGDDDDPDFSFGGGDSLGADGRTAPPADAPADDLFGEDFATAFENASAPGGDADAEPDFGGFADLGEFGDGNGEFGGNEPFGESFDEGEFESGIPRIDIGIEGLDSMILGGVPERSLMVAIGNAGTGKTTFGLQFLHEALRNGESAVYITLEESYERIVATATEKGWDFETYVENDQLAVIDLDPIEMANTLTSIRDELPRLVSEFEATRLVLDSVSLLEMMYESQSVRRNEVFDFTESLKEAGVTTMLTSEANEDNPYSSRFGIIEYLTDAVFVLRYIRSTDDFRETRLAIEIQKIRDANHSREIKPYEITDGGISVYGQANIF